MTRDSLPDQYNSQKLRNKKEKRKPLSTGELRSSNGSLKGETHEKKSTRHPTSRFI